LLMTKPMTAAVTAICASILSTSALAAESSPSPASSPVTTIVLKAAHVFDSTGTALRDGATVIVTGDKIVSAGHGPAPARARVIDLGDSTILAGFIDAHVHLTDELQSDYYKGFYKNIFRFPVEQSHYAALYAKRTLEAGFTTVRNVGADDFVDVGLRNAINANVTEGPRILTAVHALGSTGGACNQHTY